MQASARPVLFVLLITAALSLACILCSCSDDSSSNAEQLAVNAAADAGIERADVAAVVEGNLITQSDVEDYIVRYRASHGISDDVAYHAYLERYGYTDWDVRARAMKKLIDQTLVQVEAQKLGIEVDEADVTARVSSLSSRYPSEQAWVNALTHGGYNEQTYREAVRMSLLTYQVRDAVIPAIEPTEEQIAQYTVVIAPTLVGRRSSQILFAANDYATAQSVSRLIENGADFAELAREYSIDGTAELGGDMGWDCINTYATAYQDALGALDVGEVSPIVRTEFGYHIIKCTDRYDAPLNADGGIDIGAIPADLMDYVKQSISTTLKEQEFTTYISNLEATSTLAVFDQNGDQVDLEAVGLATEVTEISFEDIADSAGDDHGIGHDETENDPIDPDGPSFFDMMSMPFQMSGPGL